MKTVKVLIAVAVDVNGGWNASGWNSARPDTYRKDAMGLACEAVAEGEARYWLTAELPIPEPVEVEAKVEVPR